MPPFPEKRPRWLMGYKCGATVNEKAGPQIARIRSGENLAIGRKRLISGNARRFSPECSRSGRSAAENWTRSDQDPGTIEARSNGNGDPFSTDAADSDLRSNSMRRSK